MKAPWPDFAGADIREGDVILHPATGERGTVVFLPEHSDPSDQWRVNYGDGSLSRLCLQIGDKGQAVVETGIAIEFIASTGLDAENRAMIDFIDDQRRKIAEAFSPRPRVITRVMDDGVQTKDGAG